MTTPLPAIARPATDASHTLSGEHAGILREVTLRAAPVLAVLDLRAWPQAELGTLTAYLRTAVLRQVSDEEVYLFPHDSSAPPFAELSADHVRLHALTAQLEAVHAQPGAPVQLRALVAELLATLRRHLADEQAVLSGLPTVDRAVPGAAELVAADQAWLPDDHAPVVIDLDRLPGGQAIELSVERVLRLRAGESAELHARDGQLLYAVGRWLHDFDAERFGLERATPVADHLLRVTRRHPDASAGVGYPG